MRILEGGKGVGEPIEGIALVSQQGFGVRYDIDIATGVISNQQHDLYGKTLNGYILVCPFPKGGVAASWALADLKARGLAPDAIIFRRTSPIFVQGALFAGIPIIHQLDEDPCREISSGNKIELFPREGKITLNSN